MREWVTVPPRCSLYLHLSADARCSAVSCSQAAADNTNALRSQTSVSLHASSLLTSPFGEALVCGCVRLSLSRRGCLANRSPVLLLPLMWLVSAPAQAQADSRSAQLATLEALQAQVAALKRIEAEKQQQAEIRTGDRGPVTLSLRAMLISVC